MTRFICAMISRIEVEVEIPDGTYYNHSILDKAIKERYGDRLTEMMAEKVHMEHFTRVRE